MLIEEAKKRQIELKENLLSMAAECMDEAQLYKMIIYKNLYIQTTSGIIILSFFL